MAYFLLQYLYYTGVVVEYTSGVEIALDPRTAWHTVRSALMMSAAPFMALITCWRKGMFKDRHIVLALLMVLISMVEVAFFRETGLREGHGNFGWATMSSSYFFWVIMLGRFTGSFRQNWKESPLWRKALVILAVLVLAWHLVSAVGYYIFMLSTGNAF